MSYCYLSSTTSPVDMAALGFQAMALLESVEAVSLAPSVFETLIGTAAAVLHLGNLEFVQGPGGGLALDADPPLLAASSLLGVDAEALREALTKKTVATASDVTTTSRGKEEAAQLRDSLAEYLYRGVFQFIARRQDRACPALPTTPALCSRRPPRPFRLPCVSPRLADTRACGRAGSTGPRGQRRVRRNARASPLLTRSASVRTRRPRAQCGACAQTWRRNRCLPG